MSNALKKHQFDLSIQPKTLNHRVRLMKNQLVQLIISHQQMKYLVHKKASNQSMKQILKILFFLSPTAEIPTNYELTADDSIYFTGDLIELNKNGFKADKEEFSLTNDKKSDLHHQFTRRFIIN